MKNSAMHHSFLSAAQVYSTLMIMKIITATMQTIDLFNFFPLKKKKNRQHLRCFCLIFYSKWRFKETLFSRLSLVYKCENKIIVLCIQKKHLIKKLLRIKSKIV